MIGYERDVRFQEVDAAGMAFFPNFGVWAHEAMEAFFDPLDGGYVSLIRDRRVGLPAVRVETEFSAPLRFGDRVTVQTSVAHLGTRSLTLRYRFVRRADGVVCGEMRHTVVTTDLDRLRSCDMPEDVRRLAEAHLDAEG